MLRTMILICDADICVTLFEGFNWVLVGASIKWYSLTMVWLKNECIRKQEKSVCGDE